MPVLMLKAVHYDVRLTPLSGIQLITSLQRPLSFLDVTEGRRVSWSSVREVLDVEMDETLRKALGPVGNEAGQGYQCCGHCRHSTLLLLGSALFTFLATATSVTSTF